MTTKADAELLLAVADSIMRTQGNLASTLAEIARQLNPNTRDVDMLRSIAMGHAELMENEARNIRKAVEKHYRATAI